MQKILIDSNYLATASYHTNSDMEMNDLPVGVIFGFLRKIIQLIKEYGTIDLIFCFDSPISYRKKNSKVYKAVRSKDITEEQKAINKEIYFQLDLIRKYILSDMGFTNIHIQEGYEGDDVIGYISKKNTDSEFVVYTADKDMLALIEDYRVAWHSPVRGSLGYVDEDKFKELFNINPKAWTRVKAMTGKGSEFPGIHRVGTATAIKYLKKELKSTTKTYIAIKESKELINENLKLSQIPYRYGEVPLKIELNKQPSLDSKGFREVLRQYGLDKILDDYLYKQWCLTIKKGY